MSYGTLTLADLQATKNASTIAQVGEDTTWEAISHTLAAHNRLMEEWRSTFVETRTVESDRYGGVDAMTMEDMDEEAVPRPQKVTAGSTVGYPLNAAGRGLQWSEMWFRKHTIAELAAQVDAMMDADVQRLVRDMRRALYYSSNYTHTDHLARNIDLAVKRLVNGDGAPIPPGPNGESFDASTHTHYLARAGGAVAITDVDALVTTVREHYATGDIQVWINQADEATFRAFAGFVAYLDPRLVGSVNATQATSRTLDAANLYDRAIGILSSNGAEVWVKPLAITNYPLCWNTAAPRPLVYRYDPDYGDGLQLVYDNPSYPLRAKAYRRIFGVGVKNRINGAVLYTGNTTYADPSIN
jgi:hypothetical protein